jgi:hypothetical protein
MILNKNNIVIQHGGSIFGAIFLTIIVISLLLCSSSSLNWPFDLDTFLDGSFKQFKLTNSLSGFNDMFNKMANPFSSIKV